MVSGVRCYATAVRCDREWLRLAGFGGGFNRAMQHTNHRVGGRSVADEATTTDLLFRQPEGADVGALEGSWTLQEIGKLFDRPHTSIQQILAQTGGIRPAERHRAATGLTLAEREEISREIVAGESIAARAADIRDNHAAGRGCARPCTQSHRPTRPCSI